MANGAMIAGNSNIIRARNQSTNIGHLEKQGWASGGYISTDDVATQRIDFQSLQQSGKNI